MKEFMYYSTVQAGLGEPPLGGFGFSKYCLAYCNLELPKNQRV